MQLAQVNIEEKWKVAEQFPTLSSLITSFLPKVLLLGAIIIFIIIVIVGAAIIIGAGDKNAVENRKNILTYAIIGFIIMFGAYWILQIINFVTRGALGDILG